MTIAILSMACAGLAAAVAVLAARLYEARRGLDLAMEKARTAQESEAHAWRVARRDAEEAASSMRQARYFREMALEVWADRTALRARYEELMEEWKERSGQ